MSKAFVSSKRIRLDPETESQSQEYDQLYMSAEDEDSDSTDIKLATLASLFPHLSQESLLDLLISADGSVHRVCQTLQEPLGPISPRKRSTIDVSNSVHQASLYSLRKTKDLPRTKLGSSSVTTRKGAILHLYSPEDVAAHTPCSIVHNFLPASQAEALLKELLEEVPTFGRQSFKLFDRTVTSPHTACFYVDSAEEQTTQKTEYVYNGSYLEDVREITPQMRAVAPQVQAVVNDEVAKRMRIHYPEGKKPNYQSPKPWKPNAAFVNCYKGGAESVGFEARFNLCSDDRSVTGNLGRISYRPADLSWSKSYNWERQFGGDQGIQSAEDRRCRRQ